SWDDGLAYADWAGLRPFTELEFEKACRGPELPVPNEFAWGNTSIHNSWAYGLGSPGEASEYISAQPTGTGNAAYSQTIDLGTPLWDGPLRCGIFATGSTDRQESGAGYFGNMEFSGNLAERTITIGTSQGRSFSDYEGDGALNSSGDADAPGWPAADGAGFRGAHWDGSVDRLAISDRDQASLYDMLRNPYYGFRAAHIAPDSPR
ncbi:MAG: hypothetical protein GY869_19750, partial [Planctomycetes bacterium]|nr:hypothetical protein [Planctomycetota bacterium]